jgi:CHAT domain-containing protein
MRRDQKERSRPGKPVAVLADPVFERNDPRVFSVRSAASGADRSSSLVRSARESELTHFERLLYTRNEARAIADLTGAGSFTALDFAASRQTMLRGELDQYRILHLATHGLLNSSHPELSGLVFSLVDSRGRPQNGFFRAHEIYNLKLAADLVVLSACQTALGKEIRGEGLICLSRGFMYAGVPRVVASLWRVSDPATAELMRLFYSVMLVENLTPAAALRAAQAAMRKNPRTADPYYWAGFILQGEWN